jgi:long-chain acyl-CoA synthetase
MESSTPAAEGLREYASPAAPAHPLSTGSADMAQLLNLAVEEHGDEEAIRFHAADAWHSVSYNDLGATVHQVAKGLMANGVEQGDFVSILSGTRAEWTYADFGSLLAGTVVAPIYPTNSPEEVEYVLNHAESKVLFVENGEQLAKVESIRAACPHLKIVVVFDPGDADLGDAITLEQLKSQGQTVSDEDLKARTDAIEPGDLCTIVYTSGTTGPPKGCMITHENFRNTTTMGAITLVGVDETNEDSERVYLFLPLAHVFARLTQFVVLDLGGTLAYWRGDPALIVPDLIETKPHSLPSVPRVFEKIYALANAAADQKPPEERALFHKAIEVGLQVRALQAEGAEVPAELQAAFDRADGAVFNNVRQLFGGNIKRCVTGAAPIAKEILEFFYACGVPVYEGYGMTETSTLTSANNGVNGFKFGSIGRPVSGVTVSIADDGEILVKGPNIFQGYYKDADATAETIDADGWLHTGDLGYIDADGFIFINGRKKDIIITAGGKNLTPANWENAMKQSRWVSQAVMYGDRRPYPTAIVTIDPEEAPALRAELGLAEDVSLHDNDKVIALIESINDEVNQKFAQVEQVKKIAILDHDLTIESGELTPSLKVKRNIVHEKYESVYDALYKP